MKKLTIFLSILSFLFLFISSGESKQLYVKMTVGLFTGGNSNGSWRINPDHYDFSASPGKKLSPGMDVSLEFIFQLNPYIGFSLGNGFISKKLSGTRLRFRPFVSNYVPEDFFCNPEFSSDAVPLYLSAIVSLPVISLFQINLSGGIDYYMGQIKAANAGEIYEQKTHPSIIGRRIVWKYESRVNTLGYHFGAGLDITFPLDMFFTVDVLYRSANFKKFKRSVQEIISGMGYFRANQIGENGENLGADSTFFYLQDYSEKNVQKDFDYRVSRFDYSGLSVRVGLKFKF